MDFQFVPVGNRHSNGLDRRGSIEAAMPRFDFLDDDQLVLLFDFNRERGRAAGAAPHKRN